MTAYRYPVGAIRGDYARTAVGFVLCSLPLIFASSSPVVAAIFGALGALFLIFGLRTWKKAHQTVSVDAEGISTSGAGGANLLWKDVDKVRLSYYSTRRDQTGGWMQLVLKAGRVRVRVDSALEGFEEIARLAARAVKMNGLALGTSTTSNFLVLGIDLTDSA